MEASHHTHNYEDDPHHPMNTGEKTKARRGEVGDQGHTAKSEKRDLNTALLVSPRVSPRSQSVPRGPPPASSPSTCANLNPLASPPPSLPGPQLSSASGATILPSVQTRSFESCLLLPPPHIPVPDHPALPSLPPQCSLDPSLLPSLSISTTIVLGQATKLSILGICSSPLLASLILSAATLPIRPLLSTVSHLKEHKAGCVTLPALNSFSGSHCLQDLAPAHLSSPLLCTSSLFQDPSPSATFWHPGPAAHFFTSGPPLCCSLSLKHASPSPGQACLLVLHHVVREALLTFPDLPARLMSPSYNFHSACPSPSPHCCSAEPWAP